MEKENKEAFEKFDNYLRLRQKEGVSNRPFDIRDWILENRFVDWNIGYINRTLEKGYSANLPSLLPNARGFDDSSTGIGNYYMISGIISQDWEKSHKGGVKVLQHFQQGDHLVFFEQGFLATSHSWSEAFKSGDPKQACLGYVYDDLAHYFMADYPNRLIHRLNDNHSLSSAQIERAKAAMHRIVRQRISKYNSQPIYMPTMTAGYNRRVLVCDQAFADASTFYGKVTENDFEQMLLSAIRENPEAEILVKTHPDTHWEAGKRVGYFNHLKDVGRIRILREPLNPFCLFELVDKVYVGTSQMGFEALLAGKEVVCFGAPFYAGWGLTDDRQTIPHRKRTRTLAEIFYYFYIWYTIYNVPNCKMPSSIEEAMDYIVENRPVSEPIERSQVSSNPKVTVILPVYGVEKYLDECLHSVRHQTLRDIEIITVNDCSPDGSQAIIDRHAAEDARIRPIILKENVGQGFARNAGIEAARGEYIQFLDSDDYLATRGHLARAYQTAINDQAQMVRGRKIYEKLEDADGREIGMRRDWCEKYFEKPFHAKTLADQPEIIHGRHFWNWLYDRKFLIQNNIRFLTTQWEEKPFLLKALLRASSLSSITSEGFIYRVRVDSTARREKTIKDAELQIQNYHALIDLLSEHGAFERNSKNFYAARYLVSQFLHFMLLGFVRETIEAEFGAEGVIDLYKRLQVLLRRTALAPSDFSIEPSVLNHKLKSCHAYPLIMTALQSGRFEFVDLALNLGAMSQADYLDEMLLQPQEPEGEYLQEALSLYARNDRVVTDNASVEKGRTQGKKPRLLIHIGATKTGSTYIQHFLEKNRAALMRQGVYVPEVGLFWQDTRPHKQAGHAHFVPKAVQGESCLKDHVNAAIAMSNGGIHTVILTSEAFFLNPRAIELARQFSDFDVEMLVYLRRQDEWANSQYAEFVAGGAIGRVSFTFDDWLKTPETRNRLDYYGRIKLWETVVKKEKIHVRVYDRNQLKDGDIVSDFLAQTGLADFMSLPRPEADKENRFPFGTAHVKLIRRLNEKEWPSTECYLNFIEDAGQRITKIRSSGGDSIPKVRLLDRDKRLEILADCAESNARLAREYLGKKDGQLFQNELPHDGENVEEGITPEEFEAIIDAFEIWHQKTVDVPYQGIVGEKSICETLAYKFLLILPYFILSKRKKKKLKEKPEKFFFDSKSFFVLLLYKLAKIELNQSKTSSEEEAFISTEKTLIARCFLKYGRKMGQRKLGKLQRDPDLFFSDMKGLGGALVRSALLTEKKIRHVFTS